MKKIILLIIIVLTTFSSNAQWTIMKNDADSLVRKGSFYIYNVQFDSARVCFNEVIKKYPSHPAGYFLDAMIDWWKINLYRTTNRYNDDFIEKIDRVIEVCDSLLEYNEMDINPLFFKAGALGYRGRYYAENKDWLKAAQDGSAALSYLRKCQKMAPQNHDIMLGTGIYNYFADAIPEKYPLVKPLLAFMQGGDKELGLYELRAASRNARYAATEARVVLLQIYYSFEKNNIEAQKVAESLIEDYPNNAYFNRYLGRIYVRRGQTIQADSIWRKILIRCIDNWDGYDDYTAREALYYIGNELKRNNDFTNSLRYFEKCVEASKELDDEPSGFQINAHLKIGQIYDKLEKRNLAEKYYKKVLRMKDYGNSHKKAERYLDKPYGS